MVCFYGFNINKPFTTAVLTLVQRRRRWTNVKTALGECLVFAVILEIAARNGCVDDDVALIICMHYVIIMYVLWTV